MELSRYGPTLLEREDAQAKRGLSPIRTRIFSDNFISVDHPTNQRKSARGRSNGLSSGQILVETMVSLGVVTVGLLGIFALLSRSLGLNRTVADSYKATALASEGIEVVKNIIDTNKLSATNPWNCGLADGDYELDYATDGFNVVVCGGTQEAVPLTGFPNPLQFDLVSATYGYDAGTVTPFTRVIRVTLDPNPSGAAPLGSEVMVNSIVSWGSFTLDFEDHFFAPL